MSTTFIKVIPFFLCCLFLFGCKIDGTPYNDTCQEIPPDNEVCLAVFSRWFYEPIGDSYRFIYYSGCSELGLNFRTIVYLVNVIHK